MGRHNRKRSNAITAYVQGERNVRIAFHGFMVSAHLSTSQAQIIVSRVDMFDFSQGEAPQQCTTVLRVLEVCQLLFIDNSS